MQRISVVPVMSTNLSVIYVVQSGTSSSLMSDMLNIWIHSYMMHVVLQSQNFHSLHAQDFYSHGELKIQKKLRAFATHTQKQLQCLWC